MKLLPRNSVWKCALACLLAAQFVARAQPQPGSQNARLTREQVASLPLITHFATNKTGRFIADLADVSDGHPFLGQRSSRPHGGAHAYFDNSQSRWPKGADKPESYPAIYAPADGFVVNVTKKFRLTTGADRYGVDLAFARTEDGADLKLHLSIEPFVAEPAPGFYEQFIPVKPGQSVKKGDVIARMWTPRGQSNTHIHFQVMRNDGRGGFMAPAIFTREVVEQFHAKGGRFQRYAAPGERMPACLGYLLAAEENPFGTGVADAL
jgi:hypothetical protein